MTYREKQDRLDEIIKRLNELEEEENYGLRGVGALDFDSAIEYMADEAYCKGEEFVQPTDEEKEVIKQDCVYNDNRVIEIGEERDVLLDEYYDLAGTSPHYYDATRTYARSHKEIVTED